MTYVVLVASGIFGAIAGILLRIAGAHDFSPLLMRGLAIASYGVGFVLYAFALKRMSLTVAYPLTVAVCMICVAAFSGFVERNVTGNQLIGASIILIGICVLAWK